MVQVAEEAAEILRRDGTSVTVVNARFLKPLDNHMLLDLAQHGHHMIVLEEASQAGSLGSAVLEFFAEHGLSGLDISLMGVPDRFIEHGSIKEQLQEVGLTAEAVVRKVQEYRSGQQYTYGKKVKPS
ncbi:1-deoxy-D-xylulose-5-phosphate synthase [compost metagenome]